MDFTIGSKEEAIKAAESAENMGGNFVKVPGAYVGQIAKAVFKKFDSGAGGMEIEAIIPATDEEAERTLKVMIITMNKKGESTYTKDGKTFPLPGVNQITGGLLPVVKMKNLPAVKTDDGAVYPVLEGRRVGFLVDIRKTNGKGKNRERVYENPSLVGFFCPDTNRTGSEILRNTEPKKKVKIEAGLKVIDETTTGGDKGGSTAPGDVFDNAAGSQNDNPFEEENNAAIDTTATNETSDQPKADTPAETSEPAADKPADTPVDNTSGEASSGASDTAEEDNFWS